MNQSMSKSVPTCSEMEGSASFAGDIVRAAFAADSFCLAPHWIYDTDELDRLYPQGISGLGAPRSSYHGGKGEGDLTHYGDQMLVLLESLAARREWSSAGWLDDWAAFWNANPRSYLDGATRETLENLRKGAPKPSTSHDLSAVSRMAPLLASLRDRPLMEVALAAREQAGITHATTLVLDAAEFFARAVAAVRKGSTFAEAFEKALAGGDYAGAVAAHLESVQAAAGLDVRSAAKRFGQSCDASKGFPLTLWFALRFEGDPVEMLAANALAGGDSSARGMILAMLLAAQGSYGQLPSEWTSGIREIDRIDRALAELLERAE